MRKKSLEVIMTEKDLVFIQEQIGYKFNNVDLLQQAFIRRSYSTENGGENNEVLEFIGDKVLDLIVVKLLTTKYGYFLSQCDDYDPDIECDEFACEESESSLTQLKQMLVQKKTLANRIDILNLDIYLIMGKGDVQKNINGETSVKEDLFEAILGAVTLDCNWDINELENVVEIMLDPDSILDDDEEDNYVAYIQNWHIKEYNYYPKFKYDNSSYEEENSALHISNEIRSIPKREPNLYVINTQTYYNTHFKCWVDILKHRFIGYGKSKGEARKDVCKLIYDYLTENNLLHTIRDELDNPNKKDAISQLEILARRGYFSIPTYDFTQTYDHNGNPIWKCKCNIAEENIYFQASASIKKEAKKLAAYEMLMHVLR